MELGVYVLLTTGGGIGQRSCNMLHLALRADIFFSQTRNLSAQVHHVWHTLSPFCNKLCGSEVADAHNIFKV